MQSHSKRRSFLLCDIDSYTKLGVGGADEDLFLQEVRSIECYNILVGSNIYHVYFSEGECSLYFYISIFQITLI